MRDLLPTLSEWSEDDPLVAVATVVGTSGSTPRPMGARLLVSRDGRMAGSVSGGCLEFGSRPRSAGHHRRGRPAAIAPLRHQR